MMRLLYKTDVSLSIQKKDCQQILVDSLSLLYYFTSVSSVCATTFAAIR